MQSELMSFAFFEVSAQLIPVLFLAMVVEERLQPDNEETVADRVARSWLLALLLVGEMVALAVVAGGIRPSNSAGSVVASALLFAALLVAIPAVERELKRGRSRRERLGHATAALAV